MKFPLFSLLFTALIISALTLNAQEITSSIPVDPDTKLITYKEVVAEKGTKAEFFNRAIEWINKQYKNPAEATKVRNPQSGIIEIIHRIELTFEEKGLTRPGGIVDYSFKLELKDGRYRYTINNFTLRQASRFPIEKWMDKNDKAYSPSCGDYLEQVDKFTRQLIESLKLGMKPPAEKKPDEW